MCTSQSTDLVLQPHNYLCFQMNRTSSEIVNVDGVGVILCRSGPEGTFENV